MATRSLVVAGSESARLTLSGLALSRKHLTLDDPTPLGNYLGCGHEVIDIGVGSLSDRVGIARHVLRCDEGNLVPPSLPVRGVRYGMEGFVEQCVDRYLELTGLARSSLRRCFAPGLEDAAFTQEDYETTGQLAGQASKVIMKILYAA